MSINLFFTRRRVWLVPVGEEWARSEILRLKFSSKADFEDLTLPMVRKSDFLSISAIEQRKLRRAKNSSPS
jgi:hypothetical protein